MDAIEITWIDAHADEARGGSWCELDDIDDEPFLVRTIGWHLDGVKKGHFSVAQSISDDETQLDSILHIPTGMVRQVRKLS